MMAVIASTNESLKGTGRGGIYGLLSSSTQIILQADYPWANTWSRSKKVAYEIVKLKIMATSLDLMLTQLA